MGEGGGGILILRVDCEEAPVGEVGGCGFTGCLGEFAGEEDVVWSFGGDFDRGEEFVAGGGGVGGLVDAGEGTVGAAFEGRVVSGEGRCFEEFGVSIGEAAGPGQEEAEGEVGVEVGGVGGYGAAVGLLGGGGLVECVLGEGEVVEEMGVDGRFFDEGGEEFEGGGVVLFV